MCYIQKTDNIWSTHLIYHAQDDPVEENRAYGFAVIVIFTTEENSQIPTVSKIKGVKATALKKAVKLTWKEKDVDGYEIQYSLNKSFKSAKTIQVSENKISYTIKNLKANKTYYIRIRGYKNYTNDFK